MPPRIFRGSTVKYRFLQSKMSESPQFGQTTLYARLLAEEKVYVKVTGCRFGKTKWAISSGVASSALDNLEEADKMLKMYLSRMQTYLSVYGDKETIGKPYQVDALAKRSRDLDAALQQYKRASREYADFKVSGEKSDDYRGQICFEGGVVAGERGTECEGTGYPWYSCGDLEKFRLDKYSDETVEEITEEEYYAQVRKKDTFKNIVTEIRLPKSPYSIKYWQRRGLVIYNSNLELIIVGAPGRGVKWHFNPSAEALAKYEPNKIEIAALEAECKEILVAKLKEEGF